MSTARLHNRIRLAQLRLLVAISEAGSLQRAATALHITQPAATKTLRQLEDVVGHALVERGAGGSLLTSMGEVLCKRARLVLAELRDAEEELGLWHAGGAGHVTVGSLPVATPGLVPNALLQLQRVAPRVTVTVIEGGSDALFKELKAGALDLVVGRFYSGQDADLATEMLYDSTFRLGVRVGHPLAKRKRLEWEDVLAFPWVLPPRPVRTRPALDDLFRRARVRMPQVQVETASWLVMRSLMLQSDAIGPMPVEVFQDDLELGLVQTLPFELDMSLPPIGVVWLRRRTPSPAAELLIEQLRKVSEREGRH